MKITCSTVKLSEAVTNVQRAVSSKSTMPALEGILITAEGEVISLCGYDLEIGITTALDSRISEEGSIVLNARLFGDILRKLPSETVEISTDNRMLVSIKSGDSAFSLIGISPEEYPELHSINNETNVILPQNLLKMMTRQTIFSVATINSKPAQTGVLFEIKQG